ncbi:MAG: putative O-glycosylation ligase, exosortase A system-associated [Alphaproteobacteria bacterium]
MRALLLQFFLLGLVPASLFAPYIGIYGYYWYSYMGPNSQVFGMPALDYGKFIAVATLLGWLFSRGSKRIPFNAVTALVIVLYLWTCLTTLTARYSDIAMNDLQDWSKIVLMVLVTMSLVNSKQRVMALIWTLVISISYYGVKGGLFTLTSGGGAEVTGPAKTQIYNTNEVARAFLMTIPLSFYLVYYARHKWVRLGMLLSTLLMILGLVGTGSRTALLAFGASCFVLWLFSRRKLTYFIAAAVFGVGLLFVLSDARLNAIVDRYSTVSEYETDSSFGTRLEIWDCIFGNIAARAPVLGMGFRATENVCHRAPHSNYFEVLAEHGFIGLFIYGLLGLNALVFCLRLIRMGRTSTEHYWARDLGVMLLCSLVGYFVGGVTKNHAFFELYYVQLAILATTFAIVSKDVAQRREAERRQRTLNITGNYSTAGSAYQPPGNDVSPTPRA